MGLIGERASSYQLRLHNLETVFDVTDGRVPGDPCGRSLFLFHSTEKKKTTTFGTFIIYECLLIETILAAQRTIYNPDSHTLDPTRHRVNQHECITKWHSSRARTAESRPLKLPHSGAELRFLKFFHPKTAQLRFLKFFRSEASHSLSNPGY